MIFSNYMRFLVSMIVTMGDILAVTPIIVFAFLLQRPKKYK